jgi:hypothetical protein
VGVVPVIVRVSVRPVTVSVLVGAARVRDNVQEYVAEQAAYGKAEHHAQRWLRHHAPPHHEQNGGVASDRDRNYASKRVRPRLTRRPLLRLCVHVLRFFLVHALSIIIPARPAVVIVRMVVVLVVVVLVHAMHVRAVRVRRDGEHREQQSTRYRRCHYAVRRIRQLSRQLSACEHAPRNFNSSSSMSE